MRSFQGALLWLGMMACADPSATPAPPVVDDNGRVPDLLCPGSAGCFTTDGAFYAGAAKREITAQVEPFEDLDGDGHYQPGEPFEDLDGDQVFDPVWIAGFASGREAHGVHDPQWVRGVTLRRGDLRLGVLAIDAVGYFHDEVIRVRRAAAEAGLDLDQVIVVATHDHEAKDTMGLWGRSVSETGWDQPYMDRLVEAAVSVLRESIDAERPSVLEAAQTDVRDLIADSRLPVVVDGTLTAVLLREAEGPPIAMITVWGNHAESLSNRNVRLSSDFPHFIREEAEAAYPGAVALFLPGTLGGMMSPLDLVPCRQPDGSPGCPDESFEKAAWVGRTAAQRGVEALRGPNLRRDDAPELRVERHSFLLGFANPAFALGFGLGLFQRTLFGSDGQGLSRSRVEDMTIEQALEGAVLFQTEAGRVVLGPLDILTVPGELYPELWLEHPSGGTHVEHPANADYPDAPAEVPLASFLDGSRLKVIVNQANDALGYVLPKAQYDTEAPYAFGPERQYGEENSLGPETARRLVEEVSAMVGPRVGSAAISPR
ncbi:MAG: hypothetical protein IT384_13730 [Deltaproteobacteria bacterium]|nr:hypothetical protein [Deltaproteobacteria bacterium]